MRGSEHDVGHFVWCVVCDVWCVGCPTTAHSAHSNFNGNPSTVYQNKKAPWVFFVFICVRCGVLWCVVSALLQILDCQEVRHHAVSKWILITVRAE